MKPYHNPKNILIIKNRAIGDAVMTLSSVNYIVEQFSSANIYFAVPVGIAPLFRRCQLSLTAILPFSLRNIVDYWRLWRQLKRLKIDTVIELHQGGRTKRFFNIWQKCTAGRYFYHNHHALHGQFILDQGVIKPLIQRDLDACYSVAKTLLPGVLEIPHFLNYGPVLTLQTPVVAQAKTILFGVVATRETKIWPLAYFVELAKILLAKRPDYSIKIPLSNAPADEKIGAELIALGLPQEVEFIKVGLDQLPVEMAHASMYVGNDTGLKHIAIALGLKTYTFFGPEPPLEWHPYNEDVHKYFYSEGLPCRTLKAHYCGLTQCDSMICLNVFLPIDIYQRITWPV